MQNEDGLCFVIPTNRLRDVGETVEQYDEHFWRNGHSPEIIVFDDSTPANQEKYFPLLEKTKTHYDLYYVGPREKEQLLAYLKGVLAYLASTQATEIIPEQDAEPGKILHETRNGEMAVLREMPFARYYGSVDATPLFVQLAGAYYERTGDRDFIADIWPNIEAALLWMKRYGDRDGDSFLEYSSQCADGLLHQGWKDSDDAIFHADGSPARGRIAVCEVQGYAGGEFEYGRKCTRGGRSGSDRPCAGRSNDRDGCSRARQVQLGAVEAPGLLMEGFAMQAKAHVTELERTRADLSQKAADLVQSAIAADRELTAEEDLRVLKLTRDARLIEEELLRLKRHQNA